MRYKTKALLIPFIFFLFFVRVCAQQTEMAFTVSMSNPSTRTFHVILNCKGFNNAFYEFELPVWSPGYYQVMDFANNVEHFEATDSAGNSLTWEKTDDHTWKISNANKSNVVINYDVKTTRTFVGTSYLGDDRGYIVPAGVFMHINGQIKHPVILTIEPYSDWEDIATGLEPVEGKANTFFAPNFDIFYDCPILIGNLEKLPVFTVKGIPHRFMGYKPGDFDRQSFINDLKKIVEAATDLIGDIPYKQYTFIAIGPGGGGIEHLNSTAFAFNGNALNTEQGRIRTLHFLAHEYFHHFNVKRIRPIELGPFDYEKENRTRMLWVSEGLSVYYEYMLVKRADISTDEELLNAFSQNIRNYENKPGRLFQSLAESSYKTWDEGPFGATGDDINKTISYYDKGPAVGLLFDFMIRHSTQNKKSLDDVMKTLYQKFYLQKKRGFTEDEFREVCEDIAGNSLDELFDYVYTTKEPDYKKYLAYAGLDIDTSSKVIQGGWLGTATRMRNDTLVVASVDWQSPAWNAGIRAGNMILIANGTKAGPGSASVVFPNKTPGEVIELTVVKNKEQNKISIPLGTKKEKTFAISSKTGLDKLQLEIQENWLGKK